MNAPATVSALAVGHADIAAAAARLEGHAQRTPVLTSRTRGRAHRRDGVVQVRELPAHGRVQVSRRLQRARATVAGAEARRRARLLFGQPRPGRGAGRIAARREDRDRHAAGCAAGEARGHARLRRRSHHLRSQNGEARRTRGGHRQGARHDASFLPTTMRRSSPGRARRRRNCSSRRARWIICWCPAAAAVCSRAAPSRRAAGRRAAR